MAVYTVPAQQDLLQTYSEPAPVVGMDGNVPLSRMPPETAVYLYNILPSEYGTRTREGYAVWAQNLGGGAVKSILPFTGVTSTLATSRLFAVTQNGIYNITTQGQDNPTPVVTFADQTDEAGFCSYVHFTDPTGDSTLLVADSKNGMYEYDPNGAVWTKYTNTDITGSVDPANVAFLMVHKGRLWLIARDSADAHYLAVGAKKGAATKFQFGAKMRHGGYLVGLYEWTIDGGDGIDDYLIAVSKAGDVIAYKGTDPADATKWFIVGNWYIGIVPEGRRVSIESGGDTYLLSAYGLTSVRTLLQGTEPAKIERNVTGKIARFIRNDMLQKRDLPYWEVKLLAEEGSVVINSPRLPDSRYIQYALNINRVSEQSGGGWGMWRDIPATTFEPYEGNAFFGTTAGQVCVMRGALDGVDISGNGGVAVEFSLLSRFSDHNNPAIYKQNIWIRPYFIASNVVSIDTKIIYDYDVVEPVLTSPTYLQSPDPIWDVALWDQAVWSGTTTRSNTRGTGDYGQSIAVAIQGHSIARATLVNINGAWQPWGFL